MQGQPVPEYIRRLRYQQIESLYDSLLHPTEGRALAPKTVYEIHLIIRGALTDDLAVATRVRAQGGTIAQVAATHEVETTVRDLGHYRQLMHRWTLFALLLLRTQPVRVQALVTLVLGLPPVLLMLLVLRAWLVPSPVAWVMLGVVLILRSIVIVSLHRAVGTPGVHRAGASIASELWQPVHLVHALVSPVIVWRTRRYRVRANDDFEPV